MSSSTDLMIFIKLRRILRLLTYTFFLIFIFTIYLQWSLTLNDDRQVHNNAADNPNSAAEQSFITANHGKGRPDLAKYIHLDLKGAPPKATKFYKSFFNFIENLQMGVKGVLIEYEDTLPLQDKLVNITHRSGYTKSDIELIQTAAKTHQIEIIPLIQTFGHFEWLLKLDEYKSYRDNLNSPIVISPCINDTYVLLEDLLKQTLDMHPNSNIIHIGCDEVMITDSHPQCSETKMSALERYIHHIRRVVDIIQKIRPGIRILIWDDILRDRQLINNQKLLSQIKGIIEPVSWNYVQKFDDYYKTSPTWNIYSNFFKNIWAASAFKGGIDRFSMITNTAHHVLNNEEWLHFIESSTFRKDSFSAIILTGWSRFDHFMPLCDILPTAYSSLIYSLHILNTGQLITNNSIDDCSTLMRSVGKNSELCELLPGFNIGSTISSVSSILAQIHNCLEYLNTVAPDYNRKHLFVRRPELHSWLSKLKQLQRHLISTKQVLNRHLSELYSIDVIDEWFDLYLTPIEKQIDTTLIDFLPVQDQLSWPRRPLV